MKRRWLLLFAVCVVAVLGAVWLLVPLDAPRISQANCDKIQLGWTPAQVEDLLGEESDLYYGEPAWRKSGGLWDDDVGNVIVVSFNGASGVTGKKFTATRMSFWDQMKQRIKSRLRL